MGEIFFYGMTKINKTIFLLVALVASVSVKAQTFEEMRTLYPISDNDGKRVISGFQQFTGKDDGQLYANALKWAIDEFCQEKRDGLFDIDVKKRGFSFNMALNYEVGGKTKYAFACKSNVKVLEGKLVYAVYDIQYKSSSLLPLSSVNSIDKLNPDKKPKHKEIISSFQEMASRKLNQMFDAIVENKCSSITHWSDIDIQRPVKGMNEDECYLAFGKPNNKYEDSNGRLQWSFGLNFLLIFKEGLLETIIR